MQPLFIVLEGPDGSGTTRHVEMLGQRLLQEGHDVLVTAEPSKGPIGSQIRTFLRDGNLQPDALQMLFSADRADHVHREILPALQKGTIVVSDRYIHSTLAYGTALGLPFPWLQSMNNFFVQPTVTIFTLPPLHVCEERLSRRETRDSMEGNDLQRAVYEQYAEFAKKDPSITAVDTSGEKDDVHETIWNIVSPLLS